MSYWCGLFSALLNGTINGHNLASTAIDCIVWRKLWEQF